MKSPIETQHIKRLGLIAGEGKLPVYVADKAKAQGLEVVSFSVGRGNHDALKRFGKVHPIKPGMLQQNLELIRSEGIWHIVFAGKVNKWILLRNPQLDRYAIETISKMPRMNDDAIMLWIVGELEKHGLQVVSQTAFLEELFLSEGLLTKLQPSELELLDVEYGFYLAKEMGRIDIGQTVVVKDRMAIAIEAIEGTDECLKRAGKWARKKGGVVVKVAKPNQDQRFDVPTVGLRTLKTMRRAGLRILATEADSTLFLEPEEMIQYADRHKMVITSVQYAQVPAGIR